MPYRTLTLTLLTSLISGSALAGDCDWTPIGTSIGPAAYATAVLSDGSQVYGGSIGFSNIVIWDGNQLVAPGGMVNGF